MSSIIKKEAMALAPHMGSALCEEASGTAMHTPYTSRLLWGPACGVPCPAPVDFISSRNTTMSPVDFYNVHISAHVDVYSSAMSHI